MARSSKPAALKKAEAVVKTLQMRLKKAEMLLKHLGEKVTIFGAKPTRKGSRKTTARRGRSRSRAKTRAGKGKGKSRTASKSAKRRPGRPRKTSILPPA